MATNSVPVNKGNMKLGKRRKAKAMNAIAERKGASALGAKQKQAAVQAASRPYSKRGNITSVNEGMRVYPKKSR